MRIAPVGLVYRKADDAELKKAVFDAVRCTHVHPEGIDGAVVQAKAVALLVNTVPENFRAKDLLSGALHVAETDVMRRNINYLTEAMGKDIGDAEAINVIGNGVRAAQAVSAALLATARYGADPE